MMGANAGPNFGGEPTAAPLSLHHHDRSRSYILFPEAEYELIVSFFPLWLAGTARAPRRGASGFQTAIELRFSSSTRSTTNPSHQTRLEVPSKGPRES
jgi:hypothetical protein